MRILMRGLFFGICLFTHVVCTAETEASSDAGETYLGAGASLTLPQGNGRLSRMGGGFVRGGWYFAEFWALEGDVAWIEDAAGLAAQGLWHWWGYERFDPFFTFGVKGWIGARGGQVGPKAGTGFFYHLDDDLSLRFDADIVLGLDTAVEADYSITVGVQYAF